MIVNLEDAYQISSKLSLNKLANAWQVWSSFNYSRISKKASMKGLPISITIEPTTACNLKCPECPSGLRSFTRPTGKLNRQLFGSVIDQLYKSTGYLILYFQGEPYLNPDFLSMVEYASQMGMYTATSTNAHFLDIDRARNTIESGLNRLIISIDGATQSTYEQYRIEGSLEKVIEGTRNMIELKRKLKSSTPKIVWQFLVVRPNEKEIPQIQQMAKDIGVDHVALKTAQLYDYEDGHPLMPSNPKFSRYVKMIDGTYSMKNGLSNHCWRMWSSSVITWDGRVLPCCFDKDASHEMGNLLESSFEEIWRSEPYNEFRNKILMSRSEIDICRNCSEGTKVWT